MSKTSKHIKNGRKAFFARPPETMASLGDRIRQMRTGQSIVLTLTESERKVALQAASAAGRRIATRKTQNGSFTITRLPNG
jgi:hypothetical protein